MSLVSLKNKEDVMWLNLGFCCNKIPDYDGTIFKNLYYLDFSLGKIKEIPKSWCKIVSPKLSKINFYSNEIETIPVNFNKIFKKYPNILSVNFESNFLKDFNRHFLPKNLEHLRLSSNKISRFRIINKLDKLKILTLDYNNIKRINMNNIPEIENLYIESNKIKKIKFTKKLKVLVLSKNLIKNI